MRNSPVSRGGKGSGMRLDLSHFQVIDTHCHFFNVEYQEHNLAKTLTMSLNEVPEEDMRRTLGYRKMLKELKAFLRVEGAERDILAERKRRMEEDYRQYVAGLFKDACIDTLIIDTGYNPPGSSYEAFEEFVPAKVRYVYRIETVLDEVWKEKLSFDKAEERFCLALDEAFGSLDVVALKSIIGYRTGLHVKEVNRDDLVHGNHSEKKFRDYFFLRAVEKTMEMGCPMQVHTGFGESNIDLLANNPFLLKGFLDNPKYEGSNIIFLHGCYPYSFEAGYLANVYPNVYLDLSEINLLTPYGFRQGIRRILEMCPLSKVMYGSDGFTVPEAHWIGAKVAKEELAYLFSIYIDDGLFDESDALAAAKMILFETSKKLYHLAE